jgi:hypothetical protein
MMAANWSAIRAEEVSRRAQYLVNTSVQDLQSGLWQYKTRADLRVLRAALTIVNRRKETTKAKVLKRRIKQVKICLGVKL